MVMDFVAGQTVRSLIAEKGPLPVKQALEITRSVALALEAARQANLVHRDVKPDNILVGEGGVVKLADFGFAKSVLTAGQSGLTRDGDVVGTIAYMSPEQLESAVYADHRSDLYSLGATLYHMLTGQTPFTAKTNVDYFKQILTEVPTPIGSVRPDVPPIVRILVEKCLRKKADERYRTAGEVVRMLDVLLSSANENKTHNTG
jgi:serine/threonine-protein kinase